ncbi:hypothetical protein SHIRM173S_02555 [Streptomyces hirsutus]
MVPGEAHQAPGAARPGSPGSRQASGPVPVLAGAPAGVEAVRRDDGLFLLHRGRDTVTDGVPRPPPRPADRPPRPPAASPWADTGWRCRIRRRPCSHDRRPRAPMPGTWETAPRGRARRRLPSRAAATTETWSVRTTRDAGRVGVTHRTLVRFPDGEARTPTGGRPGLRRGAGPRCGTGCARASVRRAGVHRRPPTALGAALPPRLPDAPGPAAGRRARPYRQRVDCGTGEHCRRPRRPGPAGSSSPAPRTWPSSGSPATRPSPWASPWTTSLPGARGGLRQRPRLPRRAPRRRPAQPARPLHRWRRPRLHRSHPGRRRPGGRPSAAPPGRAARRTPPEVLLMARVRRRTGETETSRRRPGPCAPWPPTAYDGLLARHLAAHRTAYSRVTLDLAADAAERALPGSGVADPAAQPGPAGAAVRGRPLPPAVGRRPVAAPAHRPVDRRLEHGLVGGVHPRRQPQPPDRLRRRGGPARGHRGAGGTGPTPGAGLAGQRP